jgi:hypothetical protein
VEVVKNRQDEYFILVEQVDDKKVRLVTPSGELKCIELHFLGEPEELEENHLVSKNLVSKHQLSRYHRFVDEVPLEVFRAEMKREDNIVEAVDNTKRKLTRKQWEGLILKLNGMLTGR